MCIVPSVNLGSLRKCGQGQVESVKLPWAHTGWKATGWIILAPSHTWDPPFPRDLACCPGLLQSSGREKVDSSDLENYVWGFLIPTWLRHSPRSPVYEAANNVLPEEAVMVFYRGLEYLIKDFYSACLILNRSLNCRASKCQCSLNIFTCFLQGEKQQEWLRHRERWGPCPESFHQEKRKPNEDVSLISEDVEMIFILQITHQSVGDRLSD